MSYYGPGVTDPTGLQQVLAGQGGAAPSAATRAGRPGKGLRGLLRRIAGALILLICTVVALSLLSWSVTDPSLTHVANGGVRNWAGPLGAIISDLMIQMLGLASVVAVLPPAYWALYLANHGHLPHPKRKLLYAPLAVLGLALAVSSLPLIAGWPLRHGYGGVLGDIAYTNLTNLLSPVNATRSGIAAGLFGAALGLLCLQRSFGITRAELRQLFVVAKRLQPAAGQAAAAAGRQAQPSLSVQPQAWAPATAPMVAATAYAMPSAPLYQPVAPHPYTIWARHAELHQQAAAHHPHTAHPDPVALEMAMATYAGPPAVDAMSRLSLHPEPVRAAHAAAPAPRQAWLRPFPHRQPAAAPAGQHSASQHSASQHPTAPAPAAPPTHAPHDSGRLSATDRRHAPEFDHVTHQQSRAIAQRFAPHGTQPEEPCDQEHVPPASEFVTQPPPVSTLPPAWTAPARIREPDFTLPHQPTPPAAARHHAEPLALAATVAPGGFYDRLTGTQRRGDGTSTTAKRPPLSLLRLSPAPTRTLETTTTALRERSQLLLETLSDFGIKGEISAVRPGPVVTLFEFEPARGTKSSRVIGLADDIARSMSARAVRIAVVPGVNAIGIELPNSTREPVALRDLLETDQFRRTEAKLPLTLGKGIGGEPVIADLARMPHLLVAGTTGAGKSVGVNAMILSLLYHLSPDECRLILIDPKMLELSVYNGIPHLLTPVVTDSNKAVAALNWAVGEMEARYKRMSALAVRNIEAFNGKVRDSRHHEAAIDTEPMPHIVIVVDEFADLMAVAGKEIEFAVQRLAQMARAAGIHLIMATQRPSVDIITGTIKANFPTRISFRVTSRIDSRTILNEQGAEQLLGQGDMLYAGGTGQIVRVHGPFVSDAEVEAIAIYLRSTGTPAYVDGLTDTPELEASDKASDTLDEDDLYDRAVALVRNDKKASISYLQRRLNIGYNRAADIIERMERDGLVSAANGGSKREVLAPRPAAEPGPVTT